MEFSVGRMNPRRSPFGRPRRRVNTISRCPPHFEPSTTSFNFRCKTSRFRSGDPRVPQQGGGNVRHWPTARLYVQDTWRVRPGLTANYGLGWSIDRDLNYDLSKPALFAPLLGAGGLGPAAKELDEFFSRARAGLGAGAAT